MNNLTNKVTNRRGRRRVSAGLAEGKTLALYREGLHQLAQFDFEKISIAKFAKSAGTSVGAFYVRFSDKDAFLDFVSLHTFLSAQGSFERARASISSDSQPAEAFAHTLVAQFENEEFAGIVRLTVKRGFADLRRRESFDLYRSSVVDQMTEMLPESTASDRKAALASVIQASFGILTDAVLSTVPSEKLDLSNYRNVIAEILAAHFRKTKLRKSKPAKESVQTHIKKI